MSGRHQPLNGADSEPQATEYLDPQDQNCDLCCRRIYDGSLRAETHGGSTLWKCGACRERDARRYAEATAPLPKDVVPEEATFDEWMEWAGLAR